MADHPLGLEPFRINASADKTWKILADLEKYPDWNPFTVAAESTLVIGDPVVLSIPRGGKMTTQTMVLVVLEPPGPSSPGTIAWRLPKMGHKVLFSAYRVQTITPIDAQSCTYETSDTFSGLLAGSIAKATRSWVENNFAQLAKALKIEAEKTR